MRHGPRPSLRPALAERGAIAAMPINRSRARGYHADRHLAAQRHLIECRTGRLKPFRRVAILDEKPARKALGGITLAATILWLSRVSTPSGAW
ncbi:hypothetical protein GCM10011320_30910 [Neoroseomonas lacus]|uniref:Transposase n=1 Tax=Neoroseomonas lacus TaxID=287609 RepID=A0A917KQD2_9PROT|nr:hypothetical protein GCM10011320_30910 [Neoroseomonas lacus]